LFLVFSPGYAKQNLSRKVDFVRSIRVTSLNELLSVGCNLEGVADIVKEKTGPEEAQYFHVRPPIGFI